MLEIRREKLNKKIVNIPFVDLKAQYQSIKKEIDQAIDNVIDETAFIGGKYVRNFEKEFAETYGVKHCISVANGTDSLYIIMKMLGIKEGDEVITSAYSWISSSETISQTGATPVFVDIEQDYFTLDANLIESKITNKTKAIIPVHIHGQMCDMDRIIELSKKYHLHIIEDCAQSHFSEFKGQRAGTMGIASSFSFYPGKNLGAYGDAGCILTNNDELAYKFRMYSTHGALKKHDHQIEGINSRLDGLQAAILSAKLPHIFEWTAKRKSRAALYTKLFENNKFLTIPSVRSETEHSFHLYIIRLHTKREELREYLKKEGIETAIHYPNILPEMPAYKYLNYSSSDFPIAFANQSTILSIPLYPELTDEQVKYVVDTINKFYANLAG